MSAVAVSDFKIGQKLLTAEEFCEQYDGQVVELVRGVVEDVEVPKTGIHGKACLRLGSAILTYADDRDCAQLLSNDTWIRTTRGPDSVCGPDLFYVSNEQRLKGSVGLDMIRGTPEVVVEVNSPSATPSKSPMCCRGFRCQWSASLRETLTRTPR